MYANQNIEQIDRSELTRLQTERLQRVVKWVSEKSAFYSKLYGDAGVASLKIESIDDIKKLPFTTFEDLQRNSAFDFLTLPLSSILRVSRFKEFERPAAVTKMYTNGDIARQVEMMTRALIAIGITRGSTVAMLGDFSDSRLLDVHYALEMIGATVVVLGSDADNARQLLRQVAVDTLVSDSRQIMQLLVGLQALQNEGLSSSITRVLCLEESMQNSMRSYMEKRIGATIYNLYNCPALGYAGIMFPCMESSGMHIQEDHFYPELIAFGSDEPVEVPGRVAELVLTTLSAEGMPLIRFRTGQAVMKIEDSCACGRSLIRVTTPMEYKGNS